MDLKEGIKIKFACQQCGNCCRAPGFIHISKTEAHKIADYLKLYYFDFKRKYTQWILFAGRVLKGAKESSCIFLENNKCRIYSVRPKQCRTFPFWDGILKEKTELEYVKTFCKGIKD